MDTHLDRSSAAASTPALSGRGCRYFMTKSASSFGHVGTKSISSWTRDRDIREASDQLLGHRESRLELRPDPGEYLCSIM